MDEYESLIEEACRAGAEVIENYNMGDGGRLKGLYCDGVIALSNTLDTRTEKKCILAEELGHHLTATGNIINLNNTSSIKQERSGRIWSYNKYVGIMGIISAFKAHCQNRYEIAEHLAVSEEFLEEALDYYKQSYGRSVTLDSYIVKFEPNLQVYEYQMF